jgi:peptide/nickel transport system ATP-binding protein/peptide/nickel transport system permease protein
VTPFLATGRRRARVAWDPVARIAAGFLVLLGAVALLAPVVAPHDPEQGTLGEALQGPSTAHWLGTDHLGRDELSRLVFGARISLLAGIEVIVIALLIGVPIGLHAGFRGGWFDRISMRVVEVAVSLPALVVAIAVVAATGPSVTASMLAIGVLGATVMARLTRSATLTAREEDYIDAARVVGVSDRWIIVRHLLPNVAPAIIVQAALLLATAVLAEASLSFLDLGAAPPTPSWGVMLNQARPYFDEAPQLAMWPGLLVFLTVLALLQLGDRARDATGGRPTAPLDAGLVERVERVELPIGGHDATAVPGAAALELSGVSVTFERPDEPVRAVSDLWLSVAPGEVVGLVGESGAGKSTTALAALGLVAPPGRVRATSIKVDGVDIVGMAPSRLRHVRGRRIGFVAQEPATALNPAYPVGHQIAEPLRWHLDHSRASAAAEAAALLERVGIEPGRAVDYPHQFSGGEAQRIAVAMAMACRPAVLIADEPTSALDNVAQSQLLDLLLDWRATDDVAILLISHDLGVVASVADRVAVMHSGRIVETQETAALFSEPQDPYTRRLLDSAFATSTWRGVVYQ